MMNKKASPYSLAKALPLVPPLSSQPNRVHPLLQPALLCWLAVWLLLCLQLGRDNFASIDLWGKMSIAAIWNATGQFPYHDYFSYTAYGRPWIDHEWLSGFVFYNTLTHFGDIGLTLLKWSMAALMLAAVFYYNHLHRRNPFVPFIILLLGLNCLETGFLATGRPQIFTFAFTPVLFVLLTLYEQRCLPPPGEPMQVSSKTSALNLLFFLGILWANLHGGFVVALGILAIYTLCTFLRDYFPFYRSWNYLGGFLCFFLGSLVNPYGIDYWLYIYYAVTLPRVEITEWAAVPWISTREMPAKIVGIFALLAIITTLALSWLHKKAPDHKADELDSPKSPDWLAITLLLFFLYFGFGHVKHLPLFILGSALLLPGLLIDSPLNSLWIKLKDWAISNFAALRSESDRQTLAVALPAGILVGTLVALVSDAMHTNPLQMQVRDSGYTVHALRAPTYPVGAVRFLAQSSYQGKLFTPFMWGQFAYWELYPRFRVSVDGRLEAVYLMPTFRQMNNFYNVSGLDWNIPLISGADFILVETRKLDKEKTQPGHTPVYRIPTPWVMLYRDPDYAVLANRDILPPADRQRLKPTISTQRGKVYWTEQFVVPEQVEPRFARYAKEPIHAY